MQRVEERHRPDQVRRQPGQQQAALLQRLADQAEVEHLQVAQAAVDQLAAARAGAGGEVALLEQGGGEAAGDRVERDPGADDAAADDEHVELGPALGGRTQRGQGLVAGGGAEGAGLGHAPMSCARRRRAASDRWRLADGWSNPRSRRR